MIYLSDLESYNKKLELGFKKLTGYNTAFCLIGILAIAATIISGGILYLQVLGAIPENAEANLHNIMTSLALPENQNFAYIACGSLFGSAISFILHMKMLKGQMKKYIDEIHPKIISEHKAIFKDHSDEAIDAFREERDKVKLIHILKTYHHHMKFMIQNYDNFNVN